MHLLTFNYSFKLLLYCWCTMKWGHTLHHCLLLWHCFGAKVSTDFFLDNGIFYIPYYLNWERGWVNKRKMHSWSIFFWLITVLCVNSHKLYSYIAQGTCLTFVFLHLQGHQILAVITQKKETMSEETRVNNEIIGMKISGNYL